MPAQVLLFVCSCLTNSLKLKSHLLNKELCVFLTKQNKKKGFFVIFIRDEVKQKADQLRQKELQLTSFGRTLQELEDTTRYTLTFSFCRTAE